MLAFEKNHPVSALYDMLKNLCVVFLFLLIVVLGSMIFFFFFKLKPAQVFQVSKTCFSLFLPKIFNTGL